MKVTVLLNLKVKLSLLHVLLNQWRRFNCKSGWSSRYRTEKRSEIFGWTFHYSPAGLHAESGWNYLFKSEGYFHYSKYHDGSVWSSENTKETEIGGATGVGVRILDSQSGEVTLGTPVVITFNNTNSYQELNFKARMESPSKDATPGNVYAQADYKIAYE